MSSSLLPDRCCVWSRPLMELSQWWSLRAADWSRISVAWFVEGAPVEIWPSAASELASSGSSQSSGSILGCGSVSAVQRLACSHYCLWKAAFTPPSLFVGQDAVTVLALTRLLAAFSPNSSNSLLPSPHMSSVLLFFLLLRYLTRNKNVHVSFAATAKQTSALLKQSIRVNSFILHSLQLLNESEMMPESPLNDIQTDMMMMMIWTYWEGT